MSKRTRPICYLMDYPKGTTGHAQSSRLPECNSVSEVLLMLQCSLRESPAQTWYTKLVSANQNVHCCSCSLEVLHSILLATCPRGQQDFLSRLTLPPVMTSLWEYLVAHRLEPLDDPAAGADSVSLQQDVTAAKEVHMVRSCFIEPCSMRSTHFSCMCCVASASCTFLPFCCCDQAACLRSRTSAS